MCWGGPARLERESLSSCAMRTNSESPALNPKPSVSGLNPELRWPRTEPISDPQDRFQRDTCSVSPRQRYTEVGQARPGPSPALLCVVEESCGCTSHAAAHLPWDSAGPFEKCSTAGWEVGTGRRGSCPGGGGSGMRPPSRWPLRALPGPPAVPYLHYINNGLNALINTC